jgi:hypothetical protein
VTVVGGLVGTFGGAWIAEKLKGRTRLPYLAVPAVSMLPTFIFAMICLFASNK